MTFSVLSWLAMSSHGTTIIESVSEFPITCSPFQRSLILFETETQEHAFQDVIDTIIDTVRMAIADWKAFSDRDMPGHLHLHWYSHSLVGLYPNGMGSIALAICGYSHLHSPFQKTALGYAGLEFYSGFTNLERSHVCRLVWPHGCRSSLLSRACAQRAARRARKASGHYSAGRSDDHPKLRVGARGDNSSLFIACQVEEDLHQF